MKKQLLTGLFSLFILCVIAQKPSVDFKSGDWKAITTQAAKENKPILIDLYFEGCMPCKQMDQTTFVNPEVVNYVNSNYISYKTDVMKEEDGKALCVRYGVSGFPTYVILAPDGHTLDISSGYTAAPKFLAQVKASAAAATKKEYKQFSVSKPLSEYPVFLYNRYFNQEAKLAQGEVTAYLDKQQDLMDENSFLTMTNFSTSEKYSTYFFEHAPELAEKYSRMMVRNKLINIMHSKAVEKAALKDQVGFTGLFNTIKPIFASEWTRFEKIFMEDYFKASKDNDNMVLYINQSGLYDLTDKIYLTNQLLTASKEKTTLAKSLMSLYDTKSKDFDHCYMLALLNWHLHEFTATQEYLNLAIAGTPKYAKETESARKFLSAVQASNSAFKPDMLMRAKPLLAD